MTGATIDETEQYVPWLVVFFNHINHELDKNEAKGAQLSNNLGWLHEETNNRQTCSY
jgi:hypothetical protein